MYQDVQSSPKLYSRVAIEAFKALLSNSALIQKMQAEEQASIEAGEDFIPVPCQIADLALEHTEAFLPLLDRGLSENFPSSYEVRF